MKKALLFCLVQILFFSHSLLAQRVWMEPVSGSSMSGSDQVKIYFDKENSNFWENGPNGVFMHAGVVTTSENGTDWNYGNGAWDDFGSARQMTREGNYWVKTITPRTYFGVPSEIDMYRIQLVLRNEYDTSNPNNVVNNGGANFFLELDEEAVAGVVSFNPSTPRDDESVTIRFDASQGATQSLVGATKVYLHSAAITSGFSSTTWEHPVGNWGADDGLGEMTKVAGTTDTWEFTLNPRAYYGITDANEDIFRLTFVFRNEDGSVEEKDESGDFVYAINPGYYLTLDEPSNGNTVAAVGASVPVEASAPETSDFTVSIDGTQVYSATAVNSISWTTSFTSAGSHELSITSSNGTETKTKTQEVNSYSAVVRQDLPTSDLSYGVNYGSDPTKATIVLHLPTQNKEVVHLIGDFNNWEVSDNYKLKRTIAGDIWWIELTGLTAGKEYLYQFLIDGSIRVADPYTEKVADPNNDQYISDTVYPNLLPYPYDKTSEIASYLQTNQSAYAWEVDSFTPVSHNKLNIYELHLRDFTVEGTYKAATAKLDYIDALGINCIHIMPVSEFEGNDSWGYNPNYYFAADKAYGTANDLKEFIDEAHKRGIAVINDLVLNHAFNSVALARMYWDDANNKPAADNPWFNANHNFVDNTGAWWGSDFNHDSGHTQAFVDRVIEHWMTEFKFDGFRFDFTKGFSNTQWYGDWNWGSDYDQSRVNNLTRMIDQMRAHNTNAIVVFEHLANQSEDKVLADYGVLQWGGKAVTEKYEEMVLGWNESDISNSYSKDASHDFNFDNLISYMESHDEQRLAYHAHEYARDFIKNDQTELMKRMKLAAAINMLIPGPRMVWQFGELGYDYDIDYNGRTGRKPVKWEYYDDPVRRDLYDFYSLVLNLRQNHDVFHNLTGYTLDGNNWVKQLHFQNADTTVSVMVNMEAYNTSDPNNAGHYEYFDVPTGKYGSYYEAVSGQWEQLNGNYRLYAGDIKIFSNYELSSEMQQFVSSARRQLSSVVETSTSFSLNVFPNPNNGSFKVQLGGVEKANLSIYTSEGVLVYANEVSNSEDIQLPTNLKGLFILRVVSEDQSIVSKLIVE
ncbi:alpha-amylase family glycosyl hydrolase [Sediminitomix flava]|uniref:Putative secreted protein (Por secretion system target) n=1 Tax=Sediminitomix flava TaxID=379075 RepID=A0A315YYP3_SEDFL|nr:alpha-amylase family glycosyl hydrolase [Sediminitomix flava]PWJ35009.1 putative secreted protein (Por secretion system target) [Sediminitomix flava]